MRSPKEQVRSIRSSGISKQFLLPFTLDLDHDFWGLAASESEAQQLLLNTSL